MKKKTRKTKQKRAINGESKFGLGGLCCLGSLYTLHAGLGLW
jgi:hypothetical protein